MNVYNNIKYGLHKKKKKNKYSKYKEKIMHVCKIIHITICECNSVCMWQTTWSAYISNIKKKLSITIWIGNFLYTTSQNVKKKKKYDYTIRKKSKNKNVILYYSKCKSNITISLISHLYEYN